MTNSAPAPVSPQPAPATAQLSGAERHRIWDEVIRPARQLDLEARFVEADDMARAAMQDAAAANLIQDEFFVSRLSVVTGMHLVSMMNTHAADVLLRHALSSPPFRRCFDRLLEVKEPEADRGERQGAPKAKAPASNAVRSGQYDRSTSALLLVEALRRDAQRPTTEVGQGVSLRSHLATVLGRAPAKVVGAALLLAPHVDFTFRGSSGPVFQRNEGVGEVPLFHGRPYYPRRGERGIRINDAAAPPVVDQSVLHHSISGSPAVDPRYVSAVIAELEPALVERLDDLAGRGAVAEVLRMRSWPAQRLTSDREAAGTEQLLASLGPVPTVVPDLG